MPKLKQLFKPFKRKTQSIQQLMLKINHLHKCKSTTISFSKKKTSLFQINHFSKLNNDIYHHYHYSQFDTIRFESIIL